ncbi:MAG: EamA family transporter [Burkholderiales bacterium]|nr:EamA family transporter [Burkholderiales bacterium]
MNATSLALILAGVGLNAAAQLLLKAGANGVGPIELSDAGLGALRTVLISGWMFAGLACYALSVLVWILALSRVDVSVAYPMLSAGYVVTSIAAWWLFGEALTPLRLAAIGLIIVGVCLLAASARSA